MKSPVKNSLLITVAIVFVLSMVVFSGTFVPGQSVKGAPPSGLVAGVFTNNVVLQRNMPAPVWGTATAGALVTVTFNGQVKSTNAASNGKWSVTLDAMPASTAPSNMVVTSGSSNTTLTNVQVGEVWLASGQSNMALQLNGTEGSAAAIADSANHNLAWFKSSSGAAPSWVTLTPSTAGGSSAAGYHFIHNLQHQMPSVPFGLMQAAVGATDIVEWTHFGGGSGTYYDNLVVPLQPFAFRGVIWYQGENEAQGTEAQAESYYTMLPGLIAEWRTAWGQGNFPFYVVQITRYASTYRPTVRDAELQAALNDPLVELAVTVDLPETVIHPLKKEPVGVRLSLPARALIYGETGLVYSGPIANAALSAVQGNQISVGFNFLGGGLKSGGGTLLDWELASAPGGAYVAADAQIVGNTVVVSSASVPSPACVRYAYKPIPAAAANLLFNMADLPASPIREICPASGPTPTPGPSPTPAPTNTPLPPTPTVTPGGAPIMHVQDIYTTDVNGVPKSTFTAGNPIYYRVKIVDQYGVAVSGASVTCAIMRPDGPLWINQTIATGADGWALFTKTSTKNQIKGVYTINVTSVTKSGSTYDSGANVKSSTTFTLQ